MSDRQEHLLKTEREKIGPVSCLGMTFELTLSREVLVTEGMRRFQDDLGIRLSKDEAAVMADALKRDEVDLFDIRRVIANQSAIDAKKIAEHLTQQRVFEHLGDNLYRAESAIRESFAQRTEQVTEQVRRLILAIGDEPKAAVELMELLELRNRPSFQQTYLRPASELGVIEMTLPDKPRSQNQKYLITDLGRKVREKLKSVENEC